MINLLPHREAARKRRREIFYAALGASAFGGLVIAGAVWLWYGAQISNQQNRNTILSNEIKRLDNQIKDIASLQEEINALKARQQAVEDLQADRNMPVHLLNELVKQLPDGVYLTGMKQTGQTVSLVGVAQSNERVSELLRNLSSNSIWLTRPELAEIVAGNVNMGKEQRRVANFRMTVKLVRAAEAQKAASAAAPASGVVPTAAGAAPGSPAASTAVASAAMANAAPAASARK
nr:PilN domain-containing protein [Ramlibacter cellulosilyticus]